LIWLAVFPHNAENKNKALIISRIAGIFFNIFDNSGFIIINLYFYFYFDEILCIIVNGPLDVIRTRLALEEFGNRPTHAPRTTLASEYPLHELLN
jgi:hypothetical protein